MNDGHDPIAIIGAGPSGLMAAEVLAAAGMRVIIYDRMPSPARKFLIAGRGGLNLTHSEPLDIVLTRYADATDWLSTSLRNFTPNDVRAWCESLGEETFTGSSGRVFPRSMKAAPLLRAWMRRLEQLGVNYAARHTWEGFDGDALLLTDGQGKKLRISPRASLLALGGASWPRLGSNGAWVDILRAEGVDIAPLRPANCGFMVSWSPYFRERFAGVPLKPVALVHEDLSQQGEAMITANGLEGGVMYALSAQLRRAVDAHGKAQITLDLRPGMEEEALVRKLAAPRGSKSLSTYLQKAGFSPLIIALLCETATPEQLAHASPLALARRLKHLPLTLNGTSGMPRAISSAGGIMRASLTEDFMLRARPGIFACGEMLDWEAPTGGYLLQACFSTGVAAAKGIMHYTRN